MERYRLSLRRQLLLVSLLMLILPWAGYQYFAQIGRVMMEGEVEALQARVEAVAAYLESRPQLFRDLIQTRAERRIYFPEVEVAPLVDGALGDWPERAAILGTQSGVTVRMLRVGDTLYLALADLQQPDAITLRTEENLWYLGLQESGQVVARRTDDPSGTTVPGVLGSWRRAGEHLNLEVAFPLELASRRLGLAIRYAAESESLRWGLTAGGIALPWVADEQAIREALAIFQRPGSRYRYVTTDDWTLADVGGLASGEPLSGWTAWAMALLPDAEDQSDGGTSSVRWDWQLAASPPHLELHQPLSIGGLFVGTLVVERDVTEFLRLYSSLLRQWTLVSIVLFFLVAIGLFVYASWLSWRISRLSRWTRGLIDERGRVATGFAPSRAADEIGELSRDYAELTARVHKASDYLQGLAGRLSHEMRTPLAIIGSSLDNLESATEPEEKKLYTGRARQGMERLRKVLRSMSEASSLEASIDRTPRQNFDPDAVVRELAEAYRQTFAPQLIHYRGREEPRRARVDGSPELLAQLVDKLVENATSFARQGTAVDIASGQRQGHWFLEISNLGPLLPDGAEEDIFTSMVSLRSGDNSPAGHLGLGLTIVRRIAEFHRGSVSAHNLEDKSGVVVVLELPCSSRP